MKLGRTPLVFAILPGRMVAAAAAAQPDDLADKIPPLNPPLPEIPPTFWEQYHSWVWIAAGLLALVAFAFIWKLTHRKPPLLVAPATQARTELDALVKQPEDGVLLSRVSQIVRRYFSNAFGVAPGELTTAEFARALTDNQRVGAGLSGELTQFLRECDVRKFSPPQPGPAVEAVPRALNLINAAETRRQELRIADAKAAVQQASNSSAAGRI